MSDFYFAYVFGGILGSILGIILFVLLFVKIIGFIGVILTAILPYALIIGGAILVIKLILKSR